MRITSASHGRKAPASALLRHCRTTLDSCARLAALSAALLAQVAHTARSLYKRHADSACAPNADLAC